ncbi:unnamed protein product [Prorocentrum cordatum]|nr:unnamed protein product [Polarella glacialis]
MGSSVDPPTAPAATRLSLSEARSTWKAPPCTGLSTKDTLKHDPTRIRCCRAHALTARPCTTTRDRGLRLLAAGAHLRHSSAPRPTLSTALAAANAPRILGLRIGSVHLGYTGFRACRDSHQWLLEEQEHHDDDEEGEEALHGPDPALTRKPRPRSSRSSSSTRAFSREA